MQLQHWMLVVVGLDVVAEHVVVAVVVAALPWLYLEQPVSQMATVLFAAALVAVAVVVVVVTAFVLVVLAPELAAAVAVAAAVIQIDS